MFKNLFKTETVRVYKGNIIEEIHNTFYTEVDRLLAEAGIRKPEELLKTSELEKAEKLKQLGFIQTKNVKDLELKESELKKSREENSKKELTEAIQYFSVKYPQYKFITEESVKKICEKYNLVYATVDRYIGDVPEKNLQHMLDFKIDESDEAWVFKVWGLREYSNSDFAESKLKRFKADFNDDEDEASYYKASLEICAPLKDFDLESYEVEDFKLSKIEIPDPVVLKPVAYKNNAYYLIVTAWGDEASDELIVNEKFN